MAAGVIGNVTSDVLKAAIGRLRRREVSPDPLAPDSDLVLVARTAVNLQCAQLGVDEQAGADVEAFCFSAPDGWEVLFRARPRGVAATVQLSVDEERADVKAEVRLPEKLFVDREDEEVVRVLRAANGLEPSPLE